MPVCLWVGQLMDASESDWVRQIVSLLWWRWRRRRLQTAVQSSIFIVLVSRDELFGQVAERLRTFSRSVSPQVVHLLLSHHFLTYTKFHQTSMYTVSPHTPPSCLQFLYRLWVMGTDGWQLLAVSSGTSTPPFSTAPGLRQLMAWLQRLPRNSNSAPIFLSVQAEGLWGEIGGEGGVRYEMVGAVWEGGLLLTEEKCCRLATEDNCTESVM